MHSQVLVSTHLTPAQPKTIVIVSGKKGGVGKSVVAAAVYEYLVPHHGAAIGLYDLDGADGDLNVRYKDAALPLNPRRIDDFGAIIDDLMDPASPISLAVVDVGAPAGALLDRFLIEGGPADAVASGDLRIVMLWVVGSTPRSMAYLAESIEAWENAGLRDGIDLTIVANHGQGSRFDFIQASSAAEGVDVVSFPRLEEEAAQECTNLKVGFHAYTTLDRSGQYRPSFSRQSMVRRWLTRTADAFDRIPSLASLTQTSPVSAALSSEHGETWTGDALDDAHDAPLHFADEPNHPTDHSPAFQHPIPNPMSNLGHPDGEAVRAEGAPAAQIAAPVTSPAAISAPQPVPMPEPLPSTPATYLRPDPAPLAPQPATPPSPAVNSWGREFGTPTPPPSTAQTA